MGLHKDLGKENVHLPYSWEYANATARNAAVGMLPTDEGKLSRQLDDNSLWMLTNDDPVTWVQVGSAAASVFGSERQDEESLSESTTTQETYQEKLRLETPSVPAGTYRIGVSCWYYATGTTSRIHIQVERDDTEQILHMHSKTSYANSSTRDRFSGFANVVLGAGVHTFDLDYKREAGSATVGIGEARLEIWRVS
jgi:hypothetical protein